MPARRSLSYADAGVSIAEAERAAAKIKKLPARSAARARRVLDEINEPSYEIGVVAKRRRRVVYE